MNVPGVRAFDTVPAAKRAPPVAVAPPQGRLVHVVYVAPLFAPVVCLHVGSRPPGTAALQRGHNSALAWARLHGGRPGEYAVCFTTPWLPSLSVLQGIC